MGSLRRWLVDSSILGARSCTQSEL